MIVLAGLIHLPRAVMATLALAMIAGHNLLSPRRHFDSGPGRAIKRTPRAEP
jgi:uncharacterized membrane protein